MTKFISNLNMYLSEMEIKPTYLSMVTGIDNFKLSSLLNGSEEESNSDMEKIAHGLGKSIEFFLSGPVDVPYVGHSTINKPIFCTEKLSHQQELITKCIIELMANIDEVLTAKSRFINISR